MGARMTTVLCLALSALAYPSLASEWQAGVEYPVDSSVTHDGASYRCLQEHKSMARWTPPRAPALWRVEGGSPSAAPVPVVGTTGFVEAEGGALSGAARVGACAGCSAGAKVSGIGGGAGNFVVLNVVVPSAGLYSMKVSCAVDGSRWSATTVNGAAGPAVSCSGSSDSAVVEVIETLTLQEGTNSIKFHNDSAPAPDIDRIVLTPVTQ